MYYHKKQNGFGTKIESLLLEKKKFDPDILVITERGLWSEQLNLVNLEGYILYYSFPRELTKLWGGG